MMTVADMTRIEHEYYASRRRAIVNGLWLAIPFWLAVSYGWYCFWKELAR